MCPKAQNIPRKKAIVKPNLHFALTIRKKALCLLDFDFSIMSKIARFCVILRHFATKCGIDLFQTLCTALHIKICVEKFPSTRF